ncbi:MAG: translation initiation factor IF-2 N-terminal domain-containing protein, partial [Clostridia bacterium]|nr:translation initiation factor IF-2 N-terminal domain-containing protein [Clostridia bacterium]
MSKKIRISELAQEINSTNKRVMELLARIGIKVSNASSSLTEEQAEQFYESINFKRGDKSDADNNSGASAADKAAAARAAAAQNAQGGIKDPKQAQPVIRRVVVHNSGSRSDSYSNKSSSSLQAPSGLRQGLVLTQPKPKDKEGDAAPAAPAPEAPAKAGGGVRRIP